MRPAWLNLGSTFALGLLLFFPFVYYPIATLIWQLDVGFVGPYRQLLAGAASALTVSFLVLSLFAERHGLSQRLSWSVVSRTPQTWGFVFLGWLIVLTSFQRESTSVQNLIVYIVFFSAIWLAQFVQDSLLTTLRVFVWVLVPLLLLLGILHGVTSFFWSSAGAQLGGPRLYASYGVIAVVGLFAITMKTWLRVVLGGGLFAGAVISSSRSSMTTLFVVLLIGLIISAPSFWRRIAWLVPLGVIVYSAVLRLPWIQRHMAVSDITTPGFPIDDSGRGKVWIPTVESWLTQPFVGQGAGSSQTLAAQPPLTLDHPHSEYLRILHDAGLLGFLLFAAFVVLALLWLWPRANGRPRSELVVAGFLVVVAGLVLGTIENYLVFPSLMWPSAVFLGLGLAAARRDGQSVLDPRRRVRAASSEKTVLPQT